MRKSRLKILPARCLAQLGFLLLYLACPILGEMSRAQPDHGLASSLTLHVLEHCASPPKDPGDGSCSPVPEDIMVMTRNENGHATCSVATHLLNLATKCAPEDQPLSKQRSKVTIVTLKPRRLLAARSKLPASTQEPIKSLPKRQLRHRSLKRESDSSLRDSSIIAEQHLVHFERDASRRSGEERRNVRTEVTRTISRIGSDNFRNIASERRNSRNLNRDVLRSAYSGDTNRAVQGEFRRLRHVSYSRVTPSDIRNKLESSERSADKGRRSSAPAERRAYESRVADHRSRHMDARRISLAVTPERRMESPTANYESRRMSVERTLGQTGLNERRISSSSRVLTLDSSSHRSYRKTLAERRLSNSRTTETETRKHSRRLFLQGSRTAMRQQTRFTEIRLQNDEPRRSLIDRKLLESRSSEGRIRESRAMSLASEGRIRESRGMSRASEARIRESRAMSRASEGRIRESRAMSRASEGRIRESRAMSLASEGRIRESRAMSRASEGRIRESRAMSLTSEGRIRESRAMSRASEGRIRESRAMSLTSEGRIRESRAMSRASEGRIRESRPISLAARRTTTVRQRTSPDILSFRTLVTDRESRRNSVERLTLQRSSADRRWSESEGRISVEQRRRLTSEGRTLASRNSREDTRRRLSETRRSISPVRERYDSSRRVLGITRERQIFGTSQQTLLRRVSDERTASRNRDSEVSSRFVRENNIISSARRVRRSISLDRSDSHQAYFSHGRRSLSMMNDRRDFSTTAVRIRNMASKHLPAEKRMPENTHQLHLSARRDMEGRSRTAFRELSLSEVRERVRTSRERRTESPQSFSRRVRSLEERSASRRTFSLERREMRRTGDQDRRVERLSKDVTLMERRDNKRAVSDKRRSTVRAASRSSDPLLSSRRVGERQRLMQDHSAIESFNLRSRLLERENRREISYGSSRRGILEARSLDRISREDSLGFSGSRRADTPRNAGRRVSTIRATEVRDSTRALRERNISRLSRKASTERHLSADERNTRRLSAFRYAKSQDIRIAMLQDTSRRLEHNARAVHVRSLERENNYRLSSVSVEREDRQNVLATRRSSYDGLNRQNKATSAGQFLRRNVRAVSLDAVRRQLTNRQNSLVLKGLRTTQGRTYETQQNSRSLELRENRRYMLSADRKHILRDARQSTDRLMSAVQYERRAKDSMRTTRSSKSRNYSLTRERREYSNFARFNRKAVSAQELTRKSQRYEFSAFRKMAVYDNRLIASKTDNFRTPEIAAKNVTAKTDMVREALNKYGSSWLKDLTTTWQTGALWQQIFLILATISWTKIGCIDTVTDKVSSYLFASENLDIIGATKTATSNDRADLLGTVIGGGAAAAALLLFSTRTK